MEADLNTLKKLQALEQTVLFSKSQLESLQLNLNRLQEKQERLLAEIKKKQEDFQLQDLQNKKDELQLHDLEKTLKKQLVQQESTTKVEAYQALEKSNADLKSKIETLEAKILSNLDQLEADKRNYQAFELENQQTLKDVKDRIKCAKKDQLTLQAQYEAQYQQMATFEKDLDGSLYETYLTLRQSGKSFPILVPIVQGNRCSGCHLTVSPHSKTTNQPFFCEHCGRLLYVE